MEELISVIVPVYNVEAYIEECLHSLREQTYKNLQIILVDDGSTDKSGNLCDAYAAKDSRFFVIHQKNKGVLAARNAGIEKARGSFIGFVDGDDWIGKDTYKKLYDRILAEEAEIAVCQKYIYNESSKSAYEEIPVLEEGLYSGNRLEVIWENLFFQKDFLGEGISLNLYDKLFKRELLLKNYRRVDARLHYFEDMSLTLFCMLEARSIAVCNEALYYYRQRSSSLCHSIDSAYLEQLNIFYRLMYPALAQYSEKLLPRLCAYIADRAVHGVNDRMGLKLKQGIPFYLPPFEKILFSERVVLYGAGEVGKSYYRMFQIARAGQPALWVDRQYAYLQSIGMPVKPVSSLEHEPFDKILIAVKFRKNADAIRDDLIKMGIPSEKIVWECPRLLIEP